jgi:hypothetical protein
VYVGCAATALDIALFGYGDALFRSSVQNHCLAMVCAEEEADMVDGEVAPVAHVIVGIILGDNQPGVSASLSPVQNPVT